MKKQAINLGRIGILLPVAAIIPFIGPLAGLAVLVLLLMSHHYFSKFYKRPEIFKKALIGLVIPVAADLVGGIIIVIAVGSAFVSGMGGNVEKSPDFQQITGLIFESGLTIVGALVILIGSIIGYFFYFQALKVLAEKSGQKLFRTAGLLYFLGAIGIIVLFIGFFVMIVGWIVHVVAYFSIHTDEFAGEITGSAETVS
jgi:uncharacterized membrane protein